MKTIVTFVITLIISITVSAQHVEEIAQKINCPMATPDLMAVRAQLERLSGSTTDWLTLYYLAYTDLELSFRVEDVARKMQYINEAQALLEKINGGDRSEVETLKGYSYFALMAIDPRTNGPKYATDIISCYEKALKVNPNNPRAILLNALFRGSMAQSMGGQYKDFESDIARSSELFAAQDTTSMKPCWGAAFLRNN